MRFSTFGVVSIGALALLAGFTQPDKSQKPAGQPDKAVAPAGQPSEADYMAAMEKAGKPGTEHARIMQFAGNWNAKCTVVMDPNAPPHVSQGTMVNTPVLGGRQLRQDFKGDFMGEAFEGIGYWGYDNIKKQYTSLWTDSMSTMVMVQTGSFDEKAQTYSFSGTCPDPLTGKDQTHRSVIKVAGPYKHTLEMYAPGMDGKEAKMMTIEYTRAVGTSGGDATR